MPLEVAYCTQDDFRRFTEIQILTAPSGVVFKLFPRPITPAVIDRNVAQHIDAFLHQPDCHFLKVTDTETGKMISCAKWRINLKERTEEQVRKLLPKWKEGGDVEEGVTRWPEAEKDVMAYFTKRRWEFMGTKPFYCLHTLLTDPQHHRRGAGTLLLKWGLEQADRDGLPCFTESSDMGKPLYERMGFYAVHEEFFDLSKYGSEGMERMTNMLRDPKKAS